MALVLPVEHETVITAKNGIITIEQTDPVTLITESVYLSVNQFTTLCLRELEIIRSALGTADEL